MVDACRTTRHCADHGWCHRCDPALAALMSRINHVVQTVCGDDGNWGPLYTQIAEILHTGDPARAAAELAEARQTIQKLNRRAQAAESTAERYAQAVRDWRISEKGTYVPYESLKAIGALAGLEILPHVRYMQRFENARQAEEFVERIYALLEYWNTLTPPFGPPQSWWWEERRAELTDVLAGRGQPDARDSMRAQVKAAIDAAGLTDANLANHLGLSAKHVGQMLTGQATLTIGWAEKILSLCGQRLEIRAVPAIPSEGENT